MKDHLKFWGMLGLSFLIGVFLRPPSDEKLIQHIFDKREEELSALGGVNRILMERNAALEERVKNQTYSFTGEK